MTDLDVKRKRSFAAVAHESGEKALTSPMLANIKKLPTVASLWEYFPKEIKSWAGGNPNAEKNEKLDVWSMLVVNLSGAYFSGL